MNCPDTDYDSGTSTETDLRTFVYGHYIDEVLFMDDGDEYYYLHDHLYWPVALKDLDF